MMIYPFRHLERVYCAGPLFNAAERREMSQLADALRTGGFEPFVPHADGLEFACVQPYLIEQGYEPATVGQRLHEAIFALDVYQVVAGCGSLVINLNGRVPDEGAVSEAAMAWILGKPLVAFKEDARSAISGRDNPLVVGLTGFEHVARFEEVAGALAARIAAVAPPPQTAVPCPAHLAALFRAGERFWDELRGLGTERPTPTLADMICDLFGPPGTDPVECGPS